MTETINSANAAASTLFLGHDGEWWDFWLIVSLAFAAAAAVAIGITTTGSIVSHKREASAAEQKLEEYKAQSSEKIAASSAVGETAKAEAAKANESAAKLNNETARLQGDNLALQTVLQPRHVGLIGFNQEPPAKRWFGGFEQLAGTKILIQVVPGDPEAQNLANEIAIVLSKFGWRPEMIDQRRSGVDLTLSEGLSVYSPGSYKAWNADDPAQQTFAKLGQAAVALARALTQAGLGVGGYPVPGVNGLIIVVDFPPDSDAAKSQYGKFNPPLDGVYLQVGSRPVSRTLQWIAAGRPDSSGRLMNPATPQK